MKKTMFSLLAAAGLLSVMTGCQSKFNENDIISIAPDAGLSVTFDIKELQEEIRIYTIRGMKSEAGIRSVSVRGRYRRDGFFSWAFNPGEKSELLYRFNWFRADGKEITNTRTQNWKFLRIQSGEDFSIGSTAPSAEGVKAVLHITKRTGEKNVGKKDGKTEAVKAPAPKSTAQVKDQEVVSAAELKKEVEKLRADIEKQIKLDPKEPGVSLSDTDSKSARSSVRTRAEQKTAPAVTAAAQKNTPPPKDAPKTEAPKTQK